MIILKQNIKVLEELIGTIGKFTHLSKYGHFVIVPGPNDIAMTSIHNHHILPIPSFSKSMIHGFQKSSSHTNNVVANLHFTSNPCRIRFTHCHQHRDHTATTNKEIVIFRYDLLQLFQQHQIRLRTPPSASTKHENETAMHADKDNGTDMTATSDASSVSHNRRLLYKTILDQGCLIPISNVPIYWSYSHYLSLYPLPSCLVLADGSIGNHSNNQGGGSVEQYDTYCDCDIIQTISFSNNLSDSGTSTSKPNHNKNTNHGGAHAIYRPTSAAKPGSDDMKEDNDDDASESDTSERIVQFGRVG